MLFTFLDQVASSFEGTSVFYLIFSVLDPLFLALLSIGNFTSDKNEAESREWGFGRVTSAFTGY